MTVSSWYRGWPRAAVPALMAALAACSADTTSHDPEPTTTTPTASVQTTNPPNPGSATGTGSSQEASPVQIQIELGGETFTAHLDETAASRDLLAQLPTTLRMRDHGAVEKTGRLPAPLSLDGQPSGADPDVGDVGYYAPGQDLVLYYGDQSYFEGITVLGRMEAGAATRISRMRGTVTVTVSASRP